MNTNEKKLTQLPYEGNDMQTADRIRRALGYPEDSGAFTSTGGFIGLHLGPTSQRKDLRNVAIVKTREMGWMIVQTLEDVNYDLWLEIEHGGPACTAYPPKQEQE